MTITIALAGKGGVGKTTISGMVIKYLSQTQPGSILAIDADPSSNLNMVLGLELEGTVGDIREGMLSQVKESLTAGGAAMGGLRGGVSKHEHLDYEIRSSLSEGLKFDLIAMGRSEGAGCYCAVNHNLRDVVDAMSNSYNFVVIDNEAGMEHLSRRTTRDVDILLVVSDTSQRGIVAAERIAEFRHAMDINIKKTVMILNRAPSGDLPAPLKERLDQVDIPLVGVVPANDELVEFDFSGKPLVQLGDESPVYKAVVSIMDSVLAS
jgi:CO dehydrogenase maturation factor